MFSDSPAPGRKRFAISIGNSCSAVLELSALSLGATHRLLRDRLGLALPRATEVRLHETAGGNPFYALEIGRALASGRLAIEAGIFLTLTPSRDLFARHLLIAG